MYSLIIRIKLLSTFPRGNVTFNVTEHPVFYVASTNIFFQQHSGQCSMFYNEGPARFTRGSKRFIPISACWLGYSIRFPEEITRLISLRLMSLNSITLILTEMQLVEEQWHSAAAWLWIWSRIHGLLIHLETIKWNFPPREWWHWKHHPCFFSFYL